MTAVIGLAAMATQEPLLFPSLGPTAFLLFATPLAPAASPRNTLLGHLVGVVSGAIGLAAFGLLSADPDLVHGTWQRAGAAALALALTCGGMVLFDLPHPPAGATTLIVALGLLHTPLQLLLIMLSVLALTALGWAINRLAGRPCPLWRAVPAQPASSARKVRLNR